VLQNTVTRVEQLARHATARFSDPVAKNNLFRFRHVHIPKYLVASHTFTIYSRETTITRASEHGSSVTDTPISLIKMAMEKAKKRYPPSDPERAKQLGAARSKRYREKNKQDKPPKPPKSSEQKKLGDARRQKMFRRTEKQW